MLRRWLLIGIAALGVLVVAPVAWYLLSPLWIDRTVDEALPGVRVAAEQSAAPGPVATATPAATAMLTPPTATSAALPAVPSATSAPEPPTATAAPTSVPAPTAPPAEPIVLKQGQFHPVEHEGAGSATFYQLADGQRVLRLQDFSVLNGPDLHVWLSSAADASDARTILESRYVELGPLKGNQGNQNYTLPDDLDLSLYRSVTIWCRQFSVNFATAPLE